VRGRRAPGTARPGIRQPRRAHCGGGIWGGPRAHNPGSWLRCRRATSSERGLCLRGRPSAAPMLRVRQRPGLVRRLSSGPGGSARPDHAAAAPSAGGELPPNGHFDARNIQICHQNDGSDHKNAVWPVYTASRSGTSAIPSWALIRSHIAATTSTAMLRSVSSSAVLAYRPCLKRQRQRLATSVKFCAISRSGERRLVPCARDRRRF
jgi:hypothetical protein